MKVVLLGAGASKCYQASPTGLRMPISKDFFPTFFQLDLAANPWVLHGKLGAYLYDYKGVRDPYAYLQAGVDIEALHSEISLALDSATSHVERVILSGVYFELIFLFIATLNKVASGPVSGGHLALARCIDHGDTIITFNWDTLMERALQESCGWKTDDGYGFKPISIFRDNWSAASMEREVGSRAPYVLKLHGSANWLTGYPIYQAEHLALGHGLPTNSVFIYESAQTPYATWRGRYMGGYEDLTYGYYPPNLTEVPGLTATEGHAFFQASYKTPGMPEGGATADGIPSMPLIIPPVHNKQYDLFGDLFSSVWGQARTALEQCEELWVIGYSFPPTDLRSLKLFQDAFMGRQTIPKVSIIDPFPDRAAERFSRDLGIPSNYLQVFRGPFEGQETLDKLT